jgi:predicted negative regulator of RcsB-dependent stress response
MLFLTLPDDAALHACVTLRRLKVLAKTSRKKSRIAVKDLKYGHDPMIRFYEKTQDWLQDKGRPVVIAIGAILGIIVLYYIGSYFFQFRQARAESAFAAAFEKYNAQVQDPSAVATTVPTAKTYGDEATKWQETAAAFEQLANDYSSYYGTIGRYYAGVAYLHLDDSRDRGVSLLQQVADKQDERTSDLARLALAENAVVQGNIDKAIDLYEELQSSAQVLKPSVQIALGRLYDKKGDKQKAADYFFEAAKADRMTGAGTDAEKRLSAIAPERVKDLPPAISTFQP